MPCDCLIWATGYETGAAELSLTREEPRTSGPAASCVNDGADGGIEGGGGSVPFELNDDTLLFEHAICLGFPCLALPAHFFISPGPEGAREAAEYLIYHL